MALIWAGTPQQGGSGDDGQYKENKQTLPTSSTCTAFAWLEQETHLPHSLLQRLFRQRVVRMYRDGKVTSVSRLLCVAIHLRCAHTTYPTHTTHTGFNPSTSTHPHHPPTVHMHIPPPQVAPVSPSTSMPLGALLLIPNSVVQLAQEHAQRAADKAKRTRAAVEVYDGIMASDRVLYEDEHMVVLNKPSGLAVQVCMGRNVRRKYARGEM